MPRPRENAQSDADDSVRERVSTVDVVLKAMSIISIRGYLV